MRRNQPVTQQEKRFAEHCHLITTTDLNSRITAVNDSFCEIAGFDEQDLLGQPHNIIRHPDMPQAAFADLWQTIQRGDSWMGLVKNRCRNGDHYWVSAFVTPIRQHGEVVEYQSVRTCPSREQVQRAEAVYRAWATGSVPERFLARAPALLSRLVAGYLALASVLLWASIPLLAVTWIAATQALLLVTFAALLAGLWPLQRRLRAGRDGIHPAHPYIYTGRRDDSAWLTFERLKKDATLRAVSARLHANVDDIHNRKDRTMDWISQSAHSIRSQQDDLHDINRAFDALAGSVQRVSNLTRQTRDATGDADRSALHCQQQMAALDNALEQLSTDLTRANTQVLALADRSDTIGMVLDVIGDIAERTNLLALNAAIEAARAGEAGRGFAVVAEQVRNLARRTQESTREIEQIIHGLQGDARLASATLQQGVVACDQTRRNATHTQAAITSTLADIQLIAACSDQVADATEQQSSLSLQVERQAQRLLELGTRSVQSSESAQQESRHLASNVDQAHLLSNHFLQMLCGVGTEQRQAAEIQPGDSQLTPDSV